MKTADLIDDHAADLTLVHLAFRRFGRTTHIAGPVQTVKCFEDNSAVRAELETQGDGRILVVDGGGSTRAALLGDMLAEPAVSNGWSGVVLNAAIRDCVEIDRLDRAVYALGTSSVKGAKEGWGMAGCSLRIGGVATRPGDWIYAEADGVLTSRLKLV